MAEKKYIYYQKITTLLGFKEKTTKKAAGAPGGVSSWERFGGVETKEIYVSAAIFGR